MSVTCAYSLDVPPQPNQSACFSAVCDEFVVCGANFFRSVGVAEPVPDPPPPILQVFEQVTRSSMTVTWDFSEQMRAAREALGSKSAVQEDDTVQKKLRETLKELEMARAERKAEQKASRRIYEELEAIRQEREAERETLRQRCQAIEKAAGKKTQALQAKLARKTDREKELLEELTEVRAHRERFRGERDLAEQRLLAVQQEKPLASQDAVADRYGELTEELEQAREENRRLQVESDTARRRLARMEEQLADAKETWVLLRDVASKPTEMPPPASVEPTFASVIDALRAAAGEFADVLTVYGDAYISAEQSRYASPENVYRALRAIAEVGRDYFRALEGGPAVGPLELAFRQRVPFKYAGSESQTTVSQYGEERIFRHHDESRQMLRHLTLGGRNRNNCVQIYFDWCHETRRAVIGHCGRHLRYSRQRT